MDKRVGVIGIVIENRGSAAPKVNEILSDHPVIIGRMGVPYKEKGVAVIALIVDGTSDEIGALSGQLGAISGVKVKAALTGK